MKGYVEVMVGKPDKNGDKRFSFKIKNDEAWYSCGLTDPRIKKGDQIEFDFEQNGNWNNVNVDSVKILRAGPEIVEAKAGFRSTGGYKAKSDPAKDTYWKDRELRDVSTQARIQLQASRNAAIEVAELMLTAGAIKLPDAIAKRHDVIAALIGEWTERFQNETSSVGTNATEGSVGASSEIHEVAEVSKVASTGWED
jgi:hypothetical protein